jgi:hypothetical protein
MRTKLSLSLLVLAVMLTLASCGGDGVPAEPLIAGDVAGSYNGTGFTPINGFATVSDGTSMILLGTGSIGCGSESASSPPGGYTAAIAAPALAVGTYNGVFVNMYKNVGGFEGRGSTDGTLTITSVTDESISGEIQYDRLTPTNERYVITGTFEVVHCAY